MRLNNLYTCEISFCSFCSISISSMPLTSSHYSDSSYSLSSSVLSSPLASPSFQNCLSILLACFSSFLPYPQFSVIYIFSINSPSSSVSDSEAAALIVAFFFCLRFGSSALAIYLKYIFVTLTASTSLSILHSYSTIYLFCTAAFIMSVLAFVASSSLSSSVGVSVICSPSSAVFSSFFSSSLDNSMPRALS